MLTDELTRTPDHWDTNAGMIERSIALRAGRPQQVRFAIVWCCPHLVTSFDKIRKKPGEYRHADASAAIDGSPNTWFETQPTTAPGEELILDLGEAAALDGLVLDNYSMHGDSTRTLTLEASRDGAAWTPIDRVHHSPFLQQMRDAVHPLRHVRERVCEIAQIRAVNRRCRNT